MEFTLRQKIINHLTIRVKECEEIMRTANPNSRFLHIYRANLKLNKQLLENTKKDPRKWVDVVDYGID